MEAEESAPPGEDTIRPSGTEESSFASEIEEEQDVEIQYDGNGMVIGTGYQGKLSRIQ